MGAPASELFDLIVDTSTGGILALGSSLQDQQGGSFLAAKKMSGCGTPVMVNSYDIERRKTVFLKSWHPDPSELLCAEASCATSAAPTCFEPVNLQWTELTATLVDGGVFINLPAVSAHAQACKLFLDELIAMLSLGTGDLPRAITYDATRTRGCVVDYVFT